MMVDIGKILAIDTSDRNADVAVCGLAGKISRKFSTDTKSVERLPELIRACLVDLNLELQDIDKILVAIGPGSFTGIRAGIAFGQGISASLSIDLFGISNILAKAHLIDNPNGNYRVSINASKTEIFSLDIIKKDSRVIACGEVFTEEFIDGSENIMLDGYSGALALISFFRDNLAGTYEPDNFSQLLMLTNCSENTNSIAPIYVKPVTAKTLVERGLR